MATTFTKNDSNEIHLVIETESIERHRSIGKSEKVKLGVSFMEVLIHGETKVK